jgi:hypothetical protein
MYRDAIVISRRLHIPYIWIDSLCIIQDSMEDWLAESAKMGWVYKNSFLCIAATAATDNRSELLHKKELEHSRPLVHNNLVICEDIVMPNPDPSMSKLVQCDRLRTLVDWGVELAPLNQRGWVFQERMHAPRIIHCTTDEYVWECCRGITTESHPTWTKGSGVAKDTWAQIRSMGALSKEWPSAAVKTKKTLALLERWGEVITTYSGLGLSQVDDKLVACSAIVTSMQPFLGDYVAGLWKEYLPSQLLWHHDTMCGVRSGEKHHLRERRRPSWSWASLDCRVRLPFYYDGSYDREYISQMSRHMDRLIDLQASPLIKILDVGSVNDGCIRLMGRLFPIYRSVPFGYRLDTKAPDMKAILNHTKHVTWVWDDQDSRALSESEKAILDAALQPYTVEEMNTLSQGSMRRLELLHEKRLMCHNPTLTDMYCLPVLPSRSPILSENWPHAEGLVVERLGESGDQFRRVGYFIARGELLYEAPGELPKSSDSKQWPTYESASARSIETITIV